MSAFSIRYPEITNAITCDVAAVQTDAQSTRGYVKCKALWDTGALFTVVSRRLAAALHLEAIDQGCVTTVQGAYMASVYLLDVMLPNKMMIQALRVSEGDFDDCDILIGMDVIAKGDLLITNNPTTEFTFRIPSEGATPFGTPSSRADGLVRPTTP